MNLELLTYPFLDILLFKIIPFVLRCYLVNGYLDILRTLLLVLRGHNLVKQTFIVIDELVVLFLRLLSVNVQVVRKLIDVQPEYAQFLQKSLSRVSFINILHE